MIKKMNRTCLKNIRRNFIELIQMSNGFIMLKLVVMNKIGMTYSILNRLGKLKRAITHLADRNAKKNVCC